MADHDEDLEQLIYEDEDLHDEQHGPADMAQEQLAEEPANGHHEPAEAAMDDEAKHPQKPAKTTSAQRTVDVSHAGASTASGVANGPRIIDLAARAKQAQERRQAEALERRQAAEAEQRQAEAQSSNRSGIAYFIMRSNSQENLMISVQEGAWATQKHNEQKLNEAYATHEQVRLIFSINTSGHFQGFAVMRTAVGRLGRTVYWDGGQSFGSVFGVEWKCLYDLPFSETDHLRNPLNENKPVKIARDGQELPCEIGDQLVKLLEDAARRAGVKPPPPPQHRPQHPLRGGPPVLPPPRPPPKMGSRGGGMGSRSAMMMGPRGDRPMMAGMDMFMDGPMMAPNAMEMAMAMGDPMAMAAMAGALPGMRQGMMGPGAGMGGMMNPDAAMMEAALANPMMFEAMTRQGGMGSAGASMHARPALPGMGHGMPNGMLGHMPHPTSSGGPGPYPNGGSMGGRRSRSPPRRRSRERGRSRSRSRSRSGGDRKPDLLDMSYDEYLDYYRKVQRKLEDVREARRPRSPDQQLATSPLHGPGGRELTPPFGGMFGAGMGPGSMGMMGNMPGGMGGGMVGSGPMMGGGGAMMGSGMMGGGMFNSVGMAGMANPMMASAMANPMMSGMANPMMASMGMNMGMGQAKPGGQPYSEAEYIRLTINYYRSQGKTPPSDDFIRQYYRNMKSQYMGGMRS